MFVFLAKIIITVLCASPSCLPASNVRFGLKDGHKQTSINVFPSIMYALPVSTGMAGKLN